MNPTRNPLFRYLNQPDEHNSIRAAVRFGILIASLLLLVMGLAAILGLARLTDFTALICSYGLPIVVFAPLWITQSSAQTYRDITRRLSEFDLLRLTPLTERDILMALFYTVLYRARFGLAFLAATIFLLVAFGALNPAVQPGYATGGLGVPEDFSARDHVLAGVFWAIVGSALLLLYPLGILLGFSAMIGKRVPSIWVSLAWGRMLVVMLLLGIGVGVGLSSTAGIPRPTVGKVVVVIVCCPTPILMLMAAVSWSNMRGLRRRV